jgi:predicted transposase YdaD
MRVKYDILWKGLLDEVFDDFLRFVFPKVEEELDLARGFVFLDKELGQMFPEPQKKSATRHVDKLVKVYKKDGEERWLLVHVEVQEKRDVLLPQRMFQYYYRIMDKHHHPITAVAVFTGVEGKKMPDRFEDRCLGTELVYKFNTMRITDYSDEELMANENPFAIVLLVAKQGMLKGDEFDQILLDKKMLIINLLHDRGIYTKEKINAIMIFLNNYVLFKEPENNSNFMEQVDAKTGKNNTMGILEQLAEIKAEEALEKGREEGKIEGREEGKIEANENAVKALLKSTNFSASEIAEVLCLNQSIVEKIKSGLSNN